MPMQGMIYHYRFGHDDKSSQVNKKDHNLSGAGQQVGLGVRVRHYVFIQEDGKEGQHCASTRS